MIGTDFKAILFANFGGQFPSQTLEFKQLKIVMVIGVPELSVSQLMEYAVLGFFK
jgi:hypothetical protein